MSIELEIYYIYIFIHLYIRASALVIWIYGKTERQIDKTTMPDECNFDSVTYALKIEARDPFQGVDSIVNFLARREKRLSILLTYATKEQRRLICDKRNKKEKLKEEKSLFFEFPRGNLIEIIATQPLSRDYVIIVTQLSQ